MNGGTLAVVSSFHGRESLSAGYSAQEAAEMAAAVAELDGLDGLPVIHDLLPELEQRFPEGTDVWLGQRVHWRRGQHGTVALGEPASYARWQPRAGLVPWFISVGGAEVFVSLDDGYASWWPSHLLETR